MNQVSTDPRPDPRDDDPDVTLVMAGRFVLGDGADWRTWWPLIASVPGRRVGLDLSGVTAIDAAGLGLLARLAVQAWCHGRELTIVAASARVQRVLRLVGLEAVLSGGRNSPLHLDCSKFGSVKGVYR
jgi:anti-anti-sigma factor